MPLIDTQRRFHERARPRSASAGWSRQAGEPLAQATITDISQSGVGLRLRSEQPPTTGEAVRIVSREHRIPRRARVVRASTDSATGLTRLGCRWISSIERLGRTRGPTRLAGRPRR